MDLGPGTWMDEMQGLVSLTSATEVPVKARMLLIVAPKKLIKKLHAVNF